MRQINKLARDRTQNRYPLLLVAALVYRQRDGIVKCVGDLTLLANQADLNRRAPDLGILGLPEIRAFSVASRLKPTCEEFTALAQAFLVDAVPDACG
jgi:hypothetical protein